VERRQRDRHSELVSGSFKPVLNIELAIDLDARRDGDFVDHEIIANCAADRSDASFK
jgi:hypothetical protein